MTDPRARELPRRFNLSACLPVVRPHDVILNGAVRLGRQSAHLHSVGYEIIVHSTLPTNYIDHKALIIINKNFI